MVCSYIHRKQRLLSESDEVNVQFVMGVQIVIPYSPLISSLTFYSWPCLTVCQRPGEVRTIKKDDQPLDLNMVEILHMKYALWAVEGRMLETRVAAE